MPEAIATTKRKFHKLLDTFTTYANAAALPEEPTTPLTAREKLAIASQRARKRQRQDDGSPASNESRLSSTRSLPRKLPSSNKTSQQHPQQLPNFSPWSQEGFLQRLQSFSSVSLWHLKPEPINELAWAKRGWSCVDVNTVGCIGGCNRRVVVEADVARKKIIESENQDPEEDPEDEEALQAALTARYHDEIINGHSVNCLWRKTGCKDDIHRLQLVRPAIWQPTLKERYTSLTGIATSIKDVDIRATKEQLALQDTIAELGTDILPATDLDQESQSKAFHIALYGWRGSTELAAELLKCDTCFQRVGLWMYQPGYKSRTVHSDDDDDDDEDNEGTSSLNLLDMHREYCPWRSAQSQQASGSLAGMNAHEILMKVISIYVKEKRRKSDLESRPETPKAVIPDSSVATTPKPSRLEVAQQDRDRETKLAKLKRLLSVKRTPRTPLRS